MKIRSALYGAIALILFCLFFTGFIPEPTGGTTPTCLKVPFIPQLGKNWCWAACTEMVSTFYHNEVDSSAPIIRQCEEVKEALGDRCTMPCPPPDTIPKIWDKARSPFIADFGYSPQYTGKALSWDALVAQMAAKKPVIFQWQYRGITKATQDSTGSHFLVAEGCIKSSYMNFGTGWVSVHDPLPVKRGRHRIIAYSEYANKTPLLFHGFKKYVFSSHGMDIYNINYSGGN